MNINIHIPDYDSNDIVGANYADNRIIFACAPVYHTSAALFWQVKYNDVTINSLALVFISQLEYWSHAINIIIANK